MSHCTSLLPVLSLLFAGCVLTPEIVGDSLSTDGIVTSAGATTESIDSAGTESSATHVSATTESHDSHGSATSATSTTAAVSTSNGTSYVPGESEYGAPCELAFDWPIEAKAVSPQPDCEGGICLFMWDQAPPWCADDSDCPAPWSTCDGGHCLLDQGFVAETSRCTQTCDADAECPDIPGCQTGVACVPVSSIGELCCAKICACRDHLSAGQTQQLEQQCQEPGFCDP
ncbi:hypothetical protein [Nannocystis exedens]|uniref:hypothetical protein n=1 Tax=Nannocystis exedens TaxID=54 RepID=UPI000BB9FE15|nr:hypothetical protein [Nannocystis exedens]